MISLESGSTFRARERVFKPALEQKVWDHRIEPSIFQTWDKERTYLFSIRSKKRPFVIDTPPPYPSGRPWHIGAAAHYAQIDMIARTARMKGFEVLFPIGIDRNGLPVEIFTEKTYNIDIHATPRERFIELCKHALDDLEAEMIGIMRLSGLSGDYARRYRTDQTEYRQLTQTTFIELWKKGLVYEATRPNNYCPDCGTTIADAEIQYEELPTRLVYVVFSVKETGQDLAIATTRPELICSCQLVIVNPEDARYGHLQGMHAVLPIYGRDVEIRPHPSARAEFGTGAVMICSYGDYSDVILFRELGLPEIIAVDENGKLTANAGKYQGLGIEEAREKIIQDLQAEGLIAKIDEIVHRTPICERCGTPIEIIPMKEYYLKQLDFVPSLKKLAQEINFHPDFHRQLLLDWLESLRIDWPISRRRYYATEIPIWYCSQCGSPKVPEPGGYYRPWRDPAPFKRCDSCGGGEFKGETRTFDTWMDSSVSPLFVTTYGREQRFHRRTYPTAIRPQGKDIVRTWLHYSILRCFQLTGKAPFRHAWISGYGVDEKGERMSKSKGNVIDPKPILERYGADAFRFWSAAEATLGSDFRCSEARIAGVQKFLTKLWNVSRFISSFPEPRRARLLATDRWILAELSSLVERCERGYDDFNFFIPANEIREFLWETFASHYVEMVKPRAYGQGFAGEEQRAAWYTLHLSLKTILILLAPICPFITESIWRQLYGKTSIHLQRFPRPRWRKTLTRSTKSIIEFNRRLWKLKEELKVTLRTPIEASIPADLKPFDRDLRRMHYIIQKSPASAKSVAQL